MRRGSPRARRKMRGAIARRAGINPNKASLNGPQKGRNTAFLRRWGERIGTAGKVEQTQAARTRKEANLAQQRRTELERLPFRGLMSEIRFRVQQIGESKGFGTRIYHEYARQADELNFMADKGEAVKLLMKLEGLE